MPSSSSQCAPLTKRRAICQHTYGRNGEDCVVLELEEKRCLSFDRCARQAAAYYGTNVGGEKAVCSLWAESFCFGSDEPRMQAHRESKYTNNPRPDRPEEDVEEHARSAAYVNAHPRVKAHCRTVAMELAQCLTKTSR